MSADAEGSDALDVERPTVTISRSGEPADPRMASQHHHEHHDHHVLVEPQEDRWRWRRKIRQNPTQLAVYRVVVGIAGLLLICLGFVSGPIPGPGGIPLVLLGLAVWSSEFKWANRLMLWFRQQLRTYRGWSRRKQVLFWAVFFACCGLLGFSFMLVAGIPGWVPAQVEGLLKRLPGV